MSTPLTTGSISRHLVRLTLPTIGGFITLTAFNMTDTFFVSRMGTHELAAMGFTFPVVMFVAAIAIGISMGAGAVLGRAMGAGNREQMHQAATYGLLLAFGITAIVGLTGFFTMDPLFRLLGADDETLPLVKEYMRIWYAGCVVAVAPPVADGNLRATGDMIRPSFVMMTCAVFNVILDPLLIFGTGPFPGMGMAGASLATVISRAFGMAATLTFNVRAGLLRFAVPKAAQLFKMWKSILFIGLPTAFTQLMPSALRAFLTALTSGFAGAAGVAALAAGNRIEYIPLMVAVAANHALLTVTAQNFGASRTDRVAEVRRSVNRFSLMYGGVLAVVIWFTAPFVAPVFSKDPEVIQMTVQYLRILFLASAGTVMLTCMSSVLNGVHRPYVSLALNFTANAVFMIPGAVIGSRLYSADPFTGMLTGLAAGILLSGALTWIVGKTVIPDQSKDSDGAVRH